MTSKAFEFYVSDFRFHMNICIAHCAAVVRGYSNQPLTFEWVKSKGGYKRVTTPGLDCCRIRMR